MRVFGCRIIVSVSIFCKISAGLAKPKRRFVQKRRRFIPINRRFISIKLRLFRDERRLFAKRCRLFEPKSLFFSSERQPACEKARFCSLNSLTICTKLRFNSLVCSITKIKNGVIICCLLSGFKSVQRKIVCVRPLWTQKPLDTLKYE